MAKPKKPAAKRGKTRQKAKARPVRHGLRHWLRRWATRGAMAILAVVLLAVVFYAVFNPTRTPYMAAEARRQIEERQRCKVPRPVGRPPRVAKAAPVRRDQAARSSAVRSAGRSSPAELTRREPMR